MPDEGPEKAIAYLNRATSPGANLDAEARAELALAYFQIGVRLSNEKKPREANLAFDEAERRDHVYVARDRDYRTRNELAINGLPPQYLPSNMPLTPAQLRLRAQPPASLTEMEFNDVVGPFRFVHPIDAKCADAWEWFGRGMAFLDKNDPDSAIDDFTQAISLSPAFGAVLLLPGPGVYDHRRRLPRRIGPYRGDPLEARFRPGLLLSRRRVLERQGI